jgi:predicted alpha/beta hydrolase
LRHELQHRAHAIDVPILAYSFTDDVFAPKNGVDAFTQTLRKERLIHRRYAPHELGCDQIDHFGFFRRGVVPQLWNEAISYFDDALRGRKSPLRSTDTWAIDPEEIAADLAYGRA